VISVSIIFTNLVGNPEGEGIVEISSADDDGNNRTDIKAIGCEGVTRFS
jgi:hypothetical protein